KANSRPAPDAENPLTARSPPTTRAGASPLCVGNRQRPQSPRSSTATSTDQPSGAQSGRTCSAPQERSSPALTDTASPPAEGTVKTWTLRPYTFSPGRVRYAIVRPSGERDGSNTAPAVAVRRCGTPPLAATRQRALASSV